VNQYEVTLAGFGGQGIMTAGQLLSQAALMEDKQVVWLPSYGPEMRGGTAYCTVVISDSRIGSPIISNPSCVCAFNRPSFDKFSPRIKPGGLLLVNSSLINVRTDRKDITEILVPANDIAQKVGNIRATNLAVLGAFVGASQVVQFENIIAAVKYKLGKKADVLDLNLEVLDEGHKLGLQVREARAV
jgi:2-oxoglutarate ferredoxin oxidoreductase subunit gamma